MTDLQKRALPANETPTRRANHRVWGEFCDSRLRAARSGRCRCGRVLGCAVRRSGCDIGGPPGPVGCRGILTTRIADAPGKIVTRRAGFIDDATGFDAPFFGLSKRETMLIDPQHRLLLETAWRAVEHSGPRHRLWRAPGPVCSLVWAPTTTWD